MQIWLVESEARQDEEPDFTLSLNPTPSLCQVLLTTRREFIEGEDELMTQTTLINDTPCTEYEAMLPAALVEVSVWLKLKDAYGNQSDLRVLNP